MATVTRLSKDKYKVRYWNKGNQYSKTFTRKIDADRFVRTIETRKDEGTWINPQHGKTTVNEWITEWHTGRLNLRPTTASRDDSYIRNLIVPYLGEHQLNQLTPQHIRAWVATLNEQYQPATTRKAHQLLKSALNAAIEDRYIVTNPANKTPLPQQGTPTRRYLNIEETHQLADAIDRRYRAFVYCGVMTGLRPGELAALRTTNIDLRTNQLSVTHTATNHNGHITYTEPKTAASARTITMPETLTDILTEHLADQPTYLKPTDAPLVFVAPQGGPLRMSTFRRRFWKPAVQSSVGEPMRIHDMRHSHAAISIAEGTHSRVIMERLGHRNILTTMNTYGGLFAGYDEGVADALDVAFRQAEKR